MCVRNEQRDKRAKEHTEIEPPLPALPRIFYFALKGGLADATTNGPQRGSRSTIMDLRCLKCFTATEPKPLEDATKLPYSLSEGDTVAAPEPEKPVFIIPSPRKPTLEPAPLEDATNDNVVSNAQRYAQDAWERAQAAASMRRKQSSASL